MRQIRNKTEAGRVILTFWAATNTCDWGRFIICCTCTHIEKEVTTATWKNPPLGLVILSPASISVRQIIILHSGLQRPKVILRRGIPYLPHYPALAVTISPLQLHYHTQTYQDDSKSGIFLQIKFACGIIEEIGVKRYMTCDWIPPITSSKPPIADQIAWACRSWIKMRMKPPNESRSGTVVNANRWPRILIMHLKRTGTRPRSRHAVKIHNET